MSTENCQDCRDLRLELAGKQERIEALEAQLSGRKQRIAAFSDSVKRASEANLARGRGGQHVPFHGDFASAVPSVLVQLEWWAQELGR